MANLLEQARTYSAANGGHASTAATVGVTVSHFIDIISGRRPANAQFVAAMAPLIGCTPSMLRRENADLQLLLRRGSAA